VRVFEGWLLRGRPSATNPTGASREGSEILRALYFSTEITNHHGISLMATRCHAKKKKSAAKNRQLPSLF
jgi:hypothetical protein